MYYLKLLKLNLITIITTRYISGIIYVDLYIICVKDCSNIF